VGFCSGLGAAREADKLRGLAERVRRIPLRRDTERFHVEKSCMVQDLEHLAAIYEEKQALLTISRQRRTLSTEVISGRRVTVQRSRGPFFTSTR
jgi:hypothetical protein